MSLEALAPQPAATLEHRARVLLVDDKPQNLLALEEVLEPLGQELISVTSGEAALRVLLEHEVAVILLDVRMPDMDGFETAARIKRRERTRHVPIIFLTAVDDDVAQAIRGYREGAVDYLTKPFDPHVIRSKVSVFVELDAKTHMLRAQTAALERSNRELAALAEAAQAASRAKSAFLNMIGHELRTPLTVVSGYASLLLSGALGKLTEQMVRPVTLIESKADELGEMVEALLTAAHLETGDLPDNVEESDLAALAWAAVEKAQARADLIGAGLSFDAPRVPVPVRADPTQVGRILDNLVNNALTHAGERPAVKVVVTASPPAVSVEDNGRGVPESVRNEIFKRFVRGEPGGTGRAGAGLGLFIARELAVRNGGSVDLVRTAPGDGSTFALTLPPAE